jgi:hypothetical protein
LPPALDSAFMVSRMAAIGVLKVARSVATILRPGLALLPRAGNAATGRSAGHDDIHEIGETERILPAAITEKFVIGAWRRRGGLCPADRVDSDHAGVVRVKRYTFSMT